MWKVTAGRGNAAARKFLDHGVVAIGWDRVGDYTEASSKEALIQRFAAASPNDSPKQINVAAGQSWRCMRVMAKGDRVLTYDSSERHYHLANIVGPAIFNPDLIDGLPVTRSVHWTHSVSRDDLSVSTKNTLGAIMTFFQVSTVATSELEALAKGASPTATPEATFDDPGEELPESIDPFDGIGDLALERVKDRILGLDWADMQELAAALLRALGYRTIVSPGGPDRGKDIVASRDGFEFEPPRIVVEVKHRKGAMGAPEIRAFIGGRHADDRGLYVSTGGFSREAHYEAERASTVTHLMNLYGLVRALVDNYEQLDERGRLLLPLTKIYWPA